MDVQEHEGQIKKIQDKIRFAYTGGRAATFGRYSDALEIIAKEIEMDKEAARPWYVKGYVLSKLGRDKEAADAFIKAVELDPQDPGTLYLRELEPFPADSSIIMNEAIMAVIHHDPVKSSDWVKRGVDYDLFGMLDRALESYEQAISIDPENAVAWIKKGYMLGLLERNKEASAAYDKALKIEPENIQARIGKCAEALKFGRLEEARRISERIKELDPQVEMSDWILNWRDVIGS